MRPFVLFSLLFVLLDVIDTFNGCSGGGNGGKVVYNYSVIGSWMRTDQDSLMYVFNEDGTGNYQNGTADSTSFHSFTYTYQNDKISFKGNDKTDYWTVLYLTNTELTVKDANADVTTFHRY